MKNIVLLIGVLLYSQLSAQVDFSRLSLKLGFDTVIAGVSGTVCHDFTGGKKGDSIFLNGIKMTYSEVMLNGQEAEYGYNNSGIWIFLNSPEVKDTNRLCISYSCRPRKGIYFIGWNDKTGISPQQIWTQGQGINHRHWIPHRDEQTDKVVIDISVSFGKDYDVIANGVQDRNTDPANPGNWLWKYRMDKPMSSYLIAIAIGKYDVKHTKSASGIPLSQYFYPSRKDDYRWYYYKNEEIFNFMEEEIGVPYPWSNYKQIPVRNFMHGAMENTTTTIFGDFFLVDSVAFNDRNYTYVNAHELAHQWFGNLVTAINGDHHWLHEGFATYYQWLSEKNIYGKDHFDWMRLEQAELVFEASQTDTVPLGNRLAGSHRFYQKGAWVLYMLSEQLGREEFREVVKNYLKEYAYGLVSADSLQRIIAETSGIDYSGFFDFWVNTAGEPEAEIEQKSLTEDRLVINIHQKHFSDSYFSIPYSVELKYRDGKSETKIFQIDTAVQEISLDLTGPLLYWNFNPSMQVLCHEDENKPYHIWEGQIRDTDVPDRYEAVVAMDEFANTPQKKELLLAILKNEKEFHSVRAEALRQLLEADDAQYEDHLRIALNSGDVDLKKEAVGWIKPGGSFAEELEQLRAGKSYVLREEAIHKSVDTENREENAWLNDEIYELQPGIPGHQVEITALMYRVPLFRDMEALQKLVLYTSPAYDFLTRINAMVSIAALNYFSEDMIPNFMDALFSTNWKLRGEAKQMLKSYYSTKEGKRAIDSYIRKNKDDWEDFQRRTVNSTFDVNLD